jgi:hypothetical protein
MSTIAMGWSAFGVVSKPFFFSSSIFILFYKFSLKGKFVLFLMTMLGKKKGPEFVEGLICYVGTPQGVICSF